jgi:hypothetical protein
MARAILAICSSHPAFTSQILYLSLTIETNLIDAKIHSAYY